MVPGCSRTLYQGTRFGCKGASEKSFGVPQCGYAWWRRTFDRFCTFFIKWSVFAVNVICLPFWRPKKQRVLGCVDCGVPKGDGREPTNFSYVCCEERIFPLPSEIDSFLFHCSLDRLFGRVVPEAKTATLGKTGQPSRQRGSHRRDC